MIHSRRLGIVFEIETSKSDVPGFPRHFERQSWKLQGCHGMEKLLRGCALTQASSQRGCTHCVVLCAVTA
jgi:hypothetical protein